jgi:hypothetical protein
MKITFCIFLLFTLTYCIGQTNTFDLNKSDLELNSEYRVPLKFNNCEPHMEHLIVSHKPLIDSIVIFLNTHTEYIFEIGGYTTYRGKTEFNIKMSEAQAKSFKFLLVQNGANESQLKIKGYGETNLIYTPEMINKMETEKEKEDAHGENGRIVFKVISKIE